MGRDLTEAQADLLHRMGDAPDVLRNNDECRPAWWLEGGGAVRGSVAGAIIGKGFARFSQRIGGHPGLLCFTRTEAGRDALAAQRDEREDGR